MAPPERSKNASAIGIRRKTASRVAKAGYRARREEIVKAAAEVFRELGYEAATLNDIAQRLDTDRASLYYYVGSKEELLHEVVRTVLNENVQMAERVLADDGAPLDKLTALITEMIASFDRNYPHMFVYIEDLRRLSRQDSEWSRDVLRITKRFESIVIRIIEDGQSSGAFRADVSAEMAAYALFGMVNWTHTWYKPGKRSSPGDVSEAFQRIFLHGFVA